VDDLDRHGTWRSVPTYGAVWVPRGVPSGWAPYSTGAWVLDPYYGWTWIDTAPWGWAPYHYGRWVFVSGFWAWAPGPVVVRPAYAPALVAFLGGPSVGVSISVGAGPVVGWVSLGWGEPCVPWWGPSRFRHRPWWGGWGGPRVVNNVVIHRTTVVNVQEINVYRNVSARNAVVVVKENHFGRGPVTSARVRQVDAKDFKPIHTEPRVTATPASFTPREKRGISPPKKVLDRSVVATRPPQSRTESRFEKERKTEPARVPTPEPRIVSAPRQRETAPALQRPPFGKSKLERGTTDRARPPAPPKTESPQVRKQVSEGAPAVAPQAQQQRESQAVRPSQARPEPSRPQAEAGQAQQQERGSQVAPPSQAKPQAPARQTEAKSPPAQILPGEPANRLSPNRGDRRSQQRMEERREPERMPERGTSRNGPRRGRSE
jgi:hypothetical protein